ncbi:MAG: NADH-quinone oxidoreductase subunit NuoF [Chitinophagales bacterium]|jgi:NADH-quinone oxidoreductase subunit F|nr:NADH-quinone oxidoreductase subunit NuoF [Chitinophagales bacterium]
MARKLLLKNDHIAGINTLDVYQQHQGYEALKKALTMKSEDIVSEVQKSGLRGRGGAGFPTGMKWSFIAKPEGVPRYLVCNADESEPGTFKDRYLMEYHPHILIEGMIISCFALGANTGYIFIRGEYMFVLRKLEIALEEARKAGLLGKNILGSGFDCDIFVSPGAGAYICGEETALLEALEGKRGNPRMKPPFPAVKGLYQCPTVVNNVETLAAVVPILEMGGEEYAKIGIGKSTGTKLMSASGNINKPGVYEVEMGLTMQEFIYSDEYLGGIKNGKQLKACIPGGSSMPILPAYLVTKTINHEDRLLTYESINDGGFASGSMLGSGGFMIFDEDQCIVRNTWNLSRFYHHESCGQCSPCREGTGWLEKILYRIENGQAQMDDIDTLFKVQKGIDGNTICPLGEAAAWPVAAALRHFRDEFVWHVENPDLAQKQNYGLAKYAEMRPKPEPQPTN